MFYALITEGVDASLVQNKKTSEVGIAPSHDVEVRHALLRQTWQCIGVSNSVGDIRSELQTLANRFPVEGRKALSTFDSLAVRFAQLETEPDQDWLKCALRGKTPESLTFQLLPVAIVVHVPEDTFRELNPRASGVTISYRDLPEDLRDRVILMPAPPRNQHLITLRHEIIHTLETKGSPGDSLGLAATKAIAKAQTVGEVLELIATMGCFPRDKASSEIVAYLGSGDPPSSLEPYGLRAARGELEAVFRGLAQNGNLSPREKTEIYNTAVGVYRRSILDAVALSVNFEDLASRVGTERAIAQTLVQGHVDTDYSLVSRRADGLCERFEALLKSVKDDTKISEWMGQGWDDLTRDLRLCPHPRLLPLVVEAIHRSARPSQIEGLIEAFERGIEWDPEAIKAVDMEKLCSRLREIAGNEADHFKWVRAPAQKLLERHSHGELLFKPFDSQVLHPYLRVMHALSPTSSPSALMSLLCDEFPNQHPIWDSIPSGWLDDKRKTLAEHVDQISLSLTIAEHSSREYDVMKSVAFLSDCASRGELGDAHIAALRHLLPRLVSLEQTTGAQESTKARFSQSVKILSEKVGANR